MSASASRNARGAVTLSVVNIDPSREANVLIEVQGYLPRTAQGD